jgi:hypothetical protein
MVKIRLRPSRPAHSPQPATGDEQEPLQTISNTTSARTPTQVTRTSRKSASRMVMDIIDSPRRALANRKKRTTNAEKITSRGSAIAIPGFMSSNLMDVDMPETSRDRSDTYPMEVESERTFYLSHVMNWLEQDVPCDILPKILSFAGPQKIHSLCRVNKAWNRISSSEAVFRTMCEDYGKWVEGEDAAPSNDPHFWKKAFCDNPIVPLEYSSIYRATSATCKRRHCEGGNYFECDRDVRILMQPGVHILAREIVVETMDNATFTVETHTKCANLVADDCTDTTSSSSPLSSPSQSSEDNDPPARTRRRLNSGRAIRNFLSCRSSSGIDSMEYDYEIPLKSNYYARDQATILLKTNKRNCPIFHIRQGRLKLSNISLIHYCRGTDIWNGNSALQIQPRLDDRHHPIAPMSPNMLPAALVENSKIMSISGRGIVAIDGSKAYIKNCHVHRCAATGIYIGGAGSEANIYRSDVVNNGIGNNRSRQGIARGHSGVYLEQGTAIISDCSISRNALTGLSAVSLDNAILKIQDSELVGNTTLQLEMPQEGSVSFRNSDSSRNVTSREGEMRLRSGLQIGNFEDGSDSERSA